MQSVGSMGFGWMFMIIFWVLVILGVVDLMQVTLKGGESIELEETPQDILNALMFISNWGKHHAKASV